MHWPAILQNFGLSCGAPVSACSPEFPYTSPSAARCVVVCALAAFLTSLPTSRCSAAAATSERLAYLRSAVDSHVNVPRSNELNLECCIWLIHLTRTEYGTLVVWRLKCKPPPHADGPRELTRISHPLTQQTIKAASLRARVSRLALEGPAPAGCAATPTPSPCCGRPGNRSCRVCHTGRSRPRCAPCL